MSKITLKEGIQKQVDTIELTNNQFDELIRMQNTFANKRSYGKRPIITKIAGIAASVILAFVVGIFYSNQQSTMGEKIAYEVSKNHLKLKPIEVSSNQLNDLREYFTMLDFNLVHTNILSDPNWELLGARYCTIQGHTAAQLRLKNKLTGNIETLYQAPYYAKQFNNIPTKEANQSPLEEYAKGMSVKIWVEKDVLFALTNNNLEN